jgi:transposase
MPKSTQEEKYRWIKPVLDGEITIKDMSKVCPFSERTLKYWLSHYRKKGMPGLRNKSRRPKSHPRETSIRVKEEIISLRRENRLCAIKLKWKLEKHGIEVHERTIGKIIKKEGLTRRYRVRKIQYKYIKEPLRKGDLIEIDVKYVPKFIDNKRYYQFTAIDCASRWRYLKVYEEQSNVNSVDFLHEIIKVFPYKIQAIKTDNGAIFTNRYTGYLKSSNPFYPRLHALDLECQKLDIEHYLIDPGKPAQNGHVERSHRSDQESFYERIEFNNISELEYNLKLWNMYYNDLEHCGLNGLTPNQALSL